MDEIKALTVVIMVEVLATNEVEAEKHAREIFAWSEGMMVLAAREDPLKALEASRDFFVRCAKCGKNINAEYAINTGLHWICSTKIGGCGKSSGTYIFVLDRQEGKIK